MKNLSLASLLVLTSTVVAQENPYTDIGLLDYDHQVLFERLNQIAPIDTNQITQEIAQELLEKLSSQKEIGLQSLTGELRFNDSRSFNLNSDCEEDLIITPISYVQYYQSIRVVGGYFHILVQTPSHSNPKIKSIVGSFGVIKEETPKTLLSNADALKKIEEHVATKYYRVTDLPPFAETTDPMEVELSWTFDDAHKKWHLVYTTIRANFWIETEDNTGINGIWPIGLRINAETGELLEVYDGGTSCFGPAVIYKERK